MLWEKSLDLPQRAVIALILLATLLLGCGGLVPASPPPVTVVVNPDVRQVLTGQTMALTVEASGKNLRFEWSAERGKISNPQAPAVIYTAPGTPGADTVTVKVSSDAGTTVKTVPLMIISPTGTPTSTPSPTSTPTPTATFTPTPTPSSTPTPSPTPCPSIQVNLSNATPNPHDGKSTVTFTSVGKRAVGFDYDLRTGEWIMVIVPLEQNLSCLKEQGAISFYFQGSGNYNSFEVKLEDADGTNYGWTRPRASVWSGVLNLPLKDFIYWWGGDATLDWEQVKYIIFAISKQRGDEGGGGRARIEDLSIAPIACKPISVDLSSARVSSDTGIRTADLSATNTSLQLNYDLGTGGWALVTVPLNQDLFCISEKEGSISFSFEGEGAANHIEVKFEDVDGSNFGWLSSKGENVGNKIFKLSLGDDFEYWYGGDPRMNWHQTRNLLFAIAKHEEGVGGAGTIIIKDVVIAP